MAPCMIMGLGLGLNLGQKGYFVSIRPWGPVGLELCTDAVTGRITCFGKYAARLRPQIVSG